MDTLSLRTLVQTWKSDWPFQSYNGWNKYKWRWAILRKLRSKIEYVVLLKLHSYQHHTMMKLGLNFTYVSSHSQVSSFKKADIFTPLKIDRYFCLIKLFIRSVCLPVTAICSRTVWPKGAFLKWFLKFSKSVILFFFFLGLILSSWGLKEKVE